MSSLFDFQAGEDVTPAKLNRRFNAEQAYTNVLLFGAKGDGTTDDTTRLQAALDSAGPGDVLYFPGPGFLTTAPLVVNNPWVTLLSDGAVIKSADPTNGAKIQINASNVTVQELVLDGANVGTSATPSFSYGMIDVTITADTAVQNLKILRCVLQNSQGIGVRIIGNVDGVEYSENEFRDNFIHVFMEPDGVHPYRNIWGHHNRYYTTWTNATYSGSVKCKGDGDHSIHPYNLAFTDEKILASSEMGIELFDSIQDGQIVNCTIDGPTFGVSLDYCSGVTIALNKIWRNGYTGIELANLTHHCLVMGNTVEQYSSGTTRGGQHGIISSGPPCYENNYRGNTVRGCTSSALELQRTSKDVVAGNRLMDCGTPFVPKASEYVTFVGNHLFGPCDQFIFIDVNDVDTNTITIEDNHFYGAAIGDIITIYDNGHGRILTNLRIARNDVVNATMGSLSINFLMPDSQLPNLQVEDNYFKVGVAGAAQFTAKATSYEIVPPFARSMHRGGLTVATKRLVDLPLSDVPRWIKVVSLNYGSSLLMRMHIFAHNSSGSYNNELPVVIAAAPYDQGSCVELLPSGRYQPGIIDEVIYQNPTGPLQEVWLKVKAVTDPITLELHFSDYPQGVIVAPSTVTVEPTWASNSYRVAVGEMDTTYSRQVPALIARNFIASSARGVVVNAQGRLYVRGPAQTGYPGNTRVARFDLDDGSECFGIDDAGVTRVFQKLSLGGGELISSIRKQSWDGTFGTIPANTRLGFPFSVGGTVATVNPPIVWVGWSAALPAGIEFKHAYLSGDGLANVVLENTTGADIAVDGQKVTIAVIQF